MCRAFFSLFFSLYLLFCLNLIHAPQKENMHTVDYVWEFLRRTQGRF